MTPKPCKWCQSIWHSKNKCPKRPQEALPDGFLQKRAYVPFSPKKPVDTLRLAYKGDSERSQLIGYADKYHSAHVRQKGGDGTWNWCYTCGARVFVLEIQNGHFMARRYLNTRWNEMNCHPQCNDCNVVKSGNLKVYEQKLRKEYGDDNIDALKIFARTGGKVTNVEIQLIIDKYGVAF